MSQKMISNCNQTSRTPTGSGPSRMMALPDQFWLSFCIVRNGLESLKRRGSYVMVCAFRMIWYGKTVKRRNNWDLLWKKHLKLGKDLDFIMASFISTVSYIRLEMFEQYTLLFTCKSHLKCLHSFIIIIYLKLFTLKFRQAKTLCKWPKSPLTPI